MEYLEYDISDRVADSHEHKTHHAPSLFSRTPLFVSSGDVKKQLSAGTMVKKTSEIPHPSIRCGTSGLMVNNSR